MELRSDLIDTEVAICSKEILDHFNDNFDKNSLKDGFINWLYESEIIEDRVRAYEVKQQGAYMARIGDLRLYGQVTHDILSRKVYPFAIDTAAIDSNQDYEFNFPNTYIDKTASYSISCRIYSQCAIGRDACIDSGSMISSSVIGSNCKIGKNCVI